MSLQIQNWNAILLLGLEIINCHTIKGTRKVAIHAFSLCKFLDVRQYACAKDSTNIMSVHIPMILDPDACVYDACMKDAYIHDP